MTNFCKIITKGSIALIFSYVFLFVLFASFIVFPNSAKASGTITGLTPSNTPAASGSSGAGLNNGLSAGALPSNNNQNSNSPDIFKSQNYGANGSIGADSPFRWRGVNLDLSPFVSQNYSNPISQIDNISDTITGINGQSVVIPYNYSLNNSNFNGNGLALRYHSFNHIISVGDFLPPPISWILFFIPSIKDKYYYSSANFNLSYVNSSNLTMNTTDATITGEII